MGKDYREYVRECQARAADASDKAAIARKNGEDGLAKIWEDAAASQEKAADRHRTGYWG